jgi:hypothetical protein
MALGAFSDIALGTMDKKSKELKDVWLLGSNLSNSIDNDALYFRNYEYRHIISNDNNEMKQIEAEMDKLNGNISKEIKGKNSNWYNFWGHP